MKSKNLKLMSREEYYSLKDSMHKEGCSFCNWENKQIILKEFKHWVWIAAISPYWKYHTLIIPKRHFVEIVQANNEEFKELHSIYREIIHKYKKNKFTDKNGKEIKGYIFHWRIRGEKIDHNTNTIAFEHLHIHICPEEPGMMDPTIDAKAYQVDIFKLKG